MMRYFKRRVKAAVKILTRKPLKSEIERTVSIYSGISADMPVERVMVIIGSKNYLNLIRILRYADMGEIKALQFAFAFGFLAGKEGARV